MVIGILSIVFAAFVVAVPTMLTPLHYHFRDLRRRYRAPIEDPPPPRRRPAIPSDLGSLAFVTPLSMTTSLFVPGLAIRSPLLAVGIVVCSIMLYVSFFLFTHYRRLYAASKKGYETGLLAIPVLSRMSIVVVILVPILTTIAAFAPEVALAEFCFWAAVGILILHSGVSALLLARPMEKDALLVQTHLERSSILGEGLIYVDSLVHPYPLYIARFKDIYGALDHYFRGTLPPDPASRKRILEFAILYSQARKPVVEASLFELCRQAAMRRYVLRGTLLCDDGPLDVLIEAAAVRNNSVACWVAPSDAGYDGPQMLRCLHVSSLANLRRSERGSSIGFEISSQQAEQFFQDALDAEREFSLARQKVPASWFIEHSIGMG
jgi:hypothetical protein